jgi:hypothetical protein
MTDLTPELVRERLAQSEGVRQVLVHKLGIANSTIDRLRAELREAIYFVKRGQERIHSDVCGHEEANACIEMRAFLERQEKPA